MSPLVLERFKVWSRVVRRDAHALYLAARDPRVPWYAKAVAFGTAAYAASPIDLIPDFIPILGYVDDLVIVPAGLALALRLIPPDVMQEHRELAALAADRPISKAAACIIVAIWVAAFSVGSLVLYRWLNA